MFHGEEGLSAQEKVRKLVSLCDSKGRGHRTGRRFARGTPSRRGRRVLGVSDRDFGRRRQYTETPAKLRIGK
jgi:hypothetical protein